MKKRFLLYFITLILILSAPVQTLVAGEKQDIMTVDKLIGQKEYQKALAIMAKYIKDDPGNTTWLGIKSYIFMEMGQFEPALEAAFQVDKAGNRADIRSSLGIALIYIKMKNKDLAFKWLDETMNRGYLHFEELQLDPLYKPIRGDKRFKAIVAKAKNNIGLGKPAKDFSAPVLNTKDGEIGKIEKNVSLSRLKGKVVLIDFWATWCPPCVREIPRLKKYYDEFKDKGFEIIGVSMDFNTDKVRALMEKEQVDWPMIARGKGKNDEICKRYRVTSAPSFWLIDRKGILRHCGIEAGVLKEKIAQLTAE
jgi:peroxiredoxin